MIEAVIKLAAIAAAIGAVVWAVFHFIVDPLEDRGTKKQFDIDLPVLVKCHSLGTDDPATCVKSIEAIEQNAKNYKESSDKLQKNANDLAESLAACGKSITDVAARGAELTRKADEATAAERARRAASQGKLDALRAEATGPQQPAGTCDATLKTIIDHIDDGLANGL